MLQKLIKIFLLLIITISTNCFARENIFYSLRFKTEDRMCPAQATMDSLKKHYRQIDILVPQAFYIDEEGKLGGDIEPDILNFAASHSIKIMPLVTNRHFDKQKTHQFLINQQAQSEALAALLDTCSKGHFYGLQLDFEMVDKDDRDRLTAFYKSAADLMHKNGFKISFALAPVVTEHPQSLFLTKVYNNWEAAYDFRQLGEAADFVSIMAYNQHAGGTTPGSTANWRWVEQTVKYALKYIPHNKISLGLPTWSTYWHLDTTTGDISGKIMIKMQGIDYKTATDLLKKYQASLYWNKDEKYYFSIFSRDWMNELIFIEDARAFRYKYGLVKKYRLRGVSMFDLGTEDPGIWRVLGSNYV